jgi:lambda repressor-like predicted transcriptional regulator
MAERMAAFDATPAGKELAAKIERQAALYGKSESQPAIQPEFPTRAVAARRKAVVMPILANKQWTRNKLAYNAGVSPSCVNEYLDGRRRLSPKNRRAIAESLGLKPEALPE